MTARTLFQLTAAVVLGGTTPVIAGTFTFSNTNAIVINDSANPPTAASPYPSTNQATGLAGSVVTKVTVELSGFSHQFPSDVDIVLVGPQGQNAVLMGNTGSETRSPVTNLDLILDDDAPSNLPLDTPLVSGTFKPTQRNPFAFDFPAPAPATAALMGPSLSNFNGTDPNGTWSLFVVDDTSPDSGVITGGWSLTITTAPTTPPLLSITRQQTNAILSWTNTAVGFTLQSTPTLFPAAWSNVLDPTGIISGNITVTNAMTTNRTFYRLVK
jgi:hypothetical protein